MKLVVAVSNSVATEIKAAVEAAVSKGCTDSDYSFVTEEGDTVARSARGEVRLSPQGVVTFEGSRNSLRIWWKLDGLLKQAVEDGAEIINYETEAAFLQPWENMETYICRVSGKKWELGRISEQSRKGLFRAVHANPSKEGVLNALRMVRDEYFSEVRGMRTYGPYFYLFGLPEREGRKARHFREAQKRAA